MKFFIASDIHGSAYYCRRMLDAWKREGADRLVLLGDILYHGPRNDLPKDYAPKEVFAMLNEVKDSIFCVRGNCDADVDQMVLEFPIMATYAILTRAAASSMRPMATVTTWNPCRPCSLATSCSMAIPMSRSGSPSAKITII